MAPNATPEGLAAQARRHFAEEIVKGLTPLVQALIDDAQVSLDKPAEHGVKLRRRDLLQDLRSRARDWHRGMVQSLRMALGQGGSVFRPTDLPRPGSALSLVSDDTHELEIVTSRLALAMMESADWEFADLRARVAHLERRTELDAQDVLRAQSLARMAYDAWLACGLKLDDWREAQAALHEEFAALLTAAYHETNSWLRTQGVLDSIDLRPHIRRSRNLSPQSARVGWSFEGGGVATLGTGGYGSSSLPGWAVSDGLRPVQDETRLMTRIAPLARSRESTEAVLGRLNRLIGRSVPGFSASTRAAPLQPQAVSPGLERAIASAQQGLRQRLEHTTLMGEAPPTAPVLLEELHQRKQTLKQAAASPEERATIEIVALLFQSILTEDRIPAAIRVWFARLQMPVLRVAVSEPDFFATIDHPARRLIDRMGACVMGFDSSGDAAEAQAALEREVKRIVQVVEAYPDTGRRVFQTVLTEFEKFLEHYFSTENEATKRGVSLAQQVEQRETLAIQYTIELRRMLNEVPVQEGVRQFLFHVWADVLATTAVRYGGQDPRTKAMKRAAADLIWSASAKVSREERAEVIRRLPPLLKSLREGMAAVGRDAASQDEQIKALNNSLAAAFTAKAAVIPDERLRELMDRLETLEELLPDQAELDIDESMVRDLSGSEDGELEIVSDGGSLPNAPMLAWARELQVGSWFMLERQGQTEAVQLVWQGLRKQLTLFVSPKGRCVLFPQQRLAAFLQAGWLLPAQDEALTVKATRNALAKLDVDASGLLT